MSKKSIIYLIIALVLSVLLFFAYSYAKKQDYFDNSTLYKVQFDNVTNLSPGAKVTCMGLPVGKVKRMHINPNDASVIIADLKIKNEYKIHRSAVVAMKAGGLMEGNFLDIELDTICSGDDCAKKGDFFKTRTVGMMENTFGKTPAETELGIGPDDATEVFEVWKKKVISEESDHIIGITLRNMEEISNKMTELQKQMDVTAKSAGSQFEDVMSNLDGLSATMKDDKVKQIFKDLEDISKLMDEMDMKTPMDHATRTMAKAGEMQKDASISMEDMKSTMAEAKVIFKDLEQLKQKMNSSDGSVKYLMDKQGLAKDLNEALSHLNQLSQSLNEKTYYYKPFLSRKKFFRKKRKAEKKALQKTNG